jgi:ribosomal protein S3AE
MKETKTDCVECKAEQSLTRIPSINFIKTTPATSSNNKVGAVVEAHIRDAHKELKEEKEKLKNQILEVKPND